jgi:hypothetical protein
MNARKTPLIITKIFELADRLFSLITVPQKYANSYDPICSDYCHFIPKAGSLL